MTAGAYDIYIEQGATYLQDFYWTSSTGPVDVTDYSARMQLRSDYGIDPPLYTMTSGPDPDESSKTDNGMWLTFYNHYYPLPVAITDFNQFVGNESIIIGGSDGHIQLFLPAVITASFVWTNGVYDLYMISPTGFVTRLLQGKVTVGPEITELDAIVLTTTTQDSLVYGLEAVLD